ncbi:MAG TPA: GNAT family N-acetyltransferase [Solirubrobacterales bacterium]|nr:GNAT family N-acetyltransferase [Solirubrobacterales bacterium]
MSDASRRPVRALAPRRVGEAADVLAASFVDDPVYARVFPRPDRRRPALREFMAIALRDAVRNGDVDVVEAEHGLVGAAAWLPPGANPWTVGRRLRAAPGFLRLLRIAPRSMRALMGLGANAGDAFPAERDVWYLEVVGVHPDQQGAGIGSRLVGAGLERADATGAASYLETPSAANVRFYERLGFEVERDSVELLPGGPTHWLMRRPAKRAS